MAWVILIIPFCFCNREALFRWCHSSPLACCSYLAYASSKRTYSKELLFYLIWRPENRQSSILELIPQWISGSMGRLSTALSTLPSLPTKGTFIYSLKIQKTTAIKCVCISFNLRFQWKPPPVVKHLVFLSRPIIISLSFLGCVPFSNTRNISTIKLARKA